MHPSIGFVVAQIITLGVIIDAMRFHLCRQANRKAAAVLAITSGSKE
jgi:hypothetical protein